MSGGESATQAPEDDGISESLRNALSTALDTSRLTPAQAVEKMLPAPPSPEGDESDSDASPWARQWDQPVETLDHQITGFAVASSKRNADFHAIFPDAPEDDYLIEGALCSYPADSNKKGTDSTQITAVRWFATFSFRGGCTYLRTICASKATFLGG